MTTQTGNDGRGGREDRAVRRSDGTRAAILAAARYRFAEHGYERTTIRAVAADAGIDPAMVMRYYGSKDRLFDAALAIDLRLPDLRDVPRADIPGRLVRHFLARWEGEPTDDALLLLLRCAVTNERAAERVRGLLTEQVAPALGAFADERRIGLLCSQLLGLALTRYLLRVPAVADLTADEVADLYTPAVSGLFGRDGG
ncbi:TetR family transcriptional regulator [Streptomyces sp. NPDC050610]|uniref:TetR/AcrR family transcriptional regulator n=1 Tax=Streptomyces sp. NPDC050610 TaxID=3157097 RepID=UPI0034209E7E